MTIIEQRNGYKIEFNGKSTYFITDSEGDVYARVDTKRKALNRFKRVLKDAGINY